MESQLRWGCDYLLKTFSASAAANSTSNSTRPTTIVYQVAPSTRIQLETISLPKWLLRSPLPNLCIPPAQLPRICVSDLCQEIWTAVRPLHILAGLRGNINVDGV